MTTSEPPTVSPQPAASMPRPVRGFLEAIVSISSLVDAATFCVHLDDNDDARPRLYATVVVRLQNGALWHSAGGPEDARLAAYPADSPLWRELDMTVDGNLSETLDEVIRLGVAHDGTEWTLTRAEVERRPSRGELADPDSPNLRHRLAAATGLLYVRADEALLDAAEHTASALRASAEESELQARDYEVRARALIENAKLARELAAKRRTNAVTIDTLAARVRALLGGAS